MMEKLHVGYSRKAMPTELGLRIAGYGNDEKRHAEEIRDDVCFTCLAFTQGEETILLFTEDTLGASAAFVEKFREHVSEATGVPANRIMLCGTHTHAAPPHFSNADEMLPYKEKCFQVAAETAQEALADRASTELYGTKFQTEGMTFVRHYKMADGTYAGANFGSFKNSTIVDHAAKADEEMILIKMVRSGDKKDIMLMNFQAHPCFTGGSNKYVISADFVGTARDAFEQQTGMHFAYFTGSAGNQNASSKIEAECPVEKTVEQYGAEIAQLAINAMDNMEKLEGEGIKVAQVRRTFPCNHYKQERLPEAQEVIDLYRKTDQATANTLVRKYNFISFREAFGIVSCSRHPESDTLELDAVYIGGMAFVTTPFETFSHTALYVKEHSPFKYTMLFSQGNGRYSYMPSKEAFEYGCYEVFLAHFAEGTAEAVCEQLIDMLKSFQ